LFLLFLLLFLLLLVNSNLFDVDEGPLRESHAELLLGDSGWVEHRENGILYGFDVTKSMFSLGNVSEKVVLV